MPQAILRVALLGAGGIHFGSPEGPWNHAARLETLDSVMFAFVIDLRLDLARRRIEERRAGPHAEKWAHTNALSSLDELLALKAIPCDAVFVGLPPKYHGALPPSASAVEVRCAERGLHVFVEKPLSLRGMEEVRRVGWRLAEAQRNRGVVVAVGYMLRYSTVVARAKAELEGKRVAGVFARYNCSYSSIEKRGWWDVAESGGPIIEQATHFADLVRYFGGEVDLGSVSAVSVGPSYELEKIPPAESTVEFSRRIDRATAASFKFKSGAIGSLTHTLLLHGNTFDTEFEIMADGVRVVIRNPYHETPQLLVRRTGTQEYEEAVVKGKDMYHEELTTFVEAALKRDPSGIRSPYDDALKTYELTRVIADATKRNEFNKA